MKIKLGVWFSLTDFYETSILWHALSKPKYWEINGLDKCVGDTCYD